VKLFAGWLLLVGLTWLDPLYDPAAHLAVIAKTGAQVAGAKEAKVARDELANCFRFFRRRTERADNFCLPHPLKPQVCPEESKAERKNAARHHDVPRQNVILTDLLQLTLRFLSELEVGTDHFRALGCERF